MLCDIYVYICIYRGIYILCDIYVYICIYRGIWHQLENCVKQYILCDMYDEIYILSGPVFAPIQVNGEFIYIHKSIGKIILLCNM